MNQYSAEIIDLEHKMPYEQSGTNGSPKESTEHER